MLAVGIRVVADFVLAQRADDVASAAPLECAALLADHLERGADTLAGQKRGNAFGRVIALGQNVVLGVKPKDNVKLWAGGLLRRKWFGANGGCGSQSDRAFQPTAPRHVHTLPRFWQVSGKLLP